MKQKADVVVVTVVQKEMDAFNQHDLEIIHDSDGQLCFLGSFHNKKLGRDLTVVHYNVGMSGSAPAASQTTIAIQQWNPSFIVLLGIAAGIKNKGVKIGDVLIADRIQYVSSGKITEDGFSWRPIGMIFDSIISEHMRLQKVNWDKMNMHEIIKTLGNPRIHNGLVLSGEEVIDSSHRLEELQGQFGDALGVEMEARGFYDAAHRKRVTAIMVRGVSDFADGSKNDDYQDYASAVASVFLVSFLHQCDYDMIVKEDTRPPTFNGDSHSRPVEVSEALRNEILDIIDDTVGLARTSDWEKNISSLVDKLNNDPLETDSLVRYGLFILIEAAFKSNNPYKTSAVLSGIRSSLTILRELEREDTFSNWFAGYRAFYNDYLFHFLRDPDIRKYDENMYWEVREFAHIVGLTLEYSLICGDEPHYFFSYSLGIDISVRMILEGLGNPREFHTPDDDHGYPFRFSIIVEPLMKGLSKSAEILIEKQDSFSRGYVNSFLRRITTVAFAILNNCRDQGNLDDISRTGIPKLFSNSEIINQFEFSKLWVKFFEYDRPEGYQSIIQIVYDAIDVDGHSLIDQDILLHLFTASQEAYKIQIRVYKKVAHSLLKLCIKCLELYRPENGWSSRLELGMNLSDVILSADTFIPDELNYMDIVHAMVILGWLSDPSEVSAEVVTKLEKIWHDAKKWRAQIVVQLHLAIKWQSEGFLITEPDEWMHKGAEVVLKVIKTLPKE